ncbi:MAG: hypothetical protein AB1553_04570 [Nitrospirota bacterium]
MDIKKIKKTLTVTEKDKQTFITAALDESLSIGRLSVAIFIAVVVMSAAFNIAAEIAR